MKLKRILALVVMFVIFVNLCPVYAASTQPGVMSGKLGDNVSWVLNDKIIVVSGSGNTYDFAGKSASFTDFKNISNVESLIIEEGITGIGKNTFNSLYLLSDVTFPASLETIGDNAFTGTYLKEISFPEKSMLKTIGKEAFKSCHQLQKIDLSECNNLETIDDYCFCYCSDISVALLPPMGKLSKISDGTFWGCDALLNLVVPSSVKTIGENAFYGCWDMHYISIPAQTQAIAQNAFMGFEPFIFASPDSYAQNYAQTNGFKYSNAPHTESVVVKEGTMSNGIMWNYTNHGTLTISGNGAIEDFSSSPYAPWYRLGNKGLTNLVISEGITHIGRENFSQFKKLKTVSLPSTLKTIGMYGFTGCESLEKLILPEGFAGLGENALYSCSSLKELVIPSTMYIIGDWALYGLDSIEKYTVSPLNQAFSSDENGVLYNGGKTAIIKYPSASDLKSYTVPASVKEIYPNAFNSCYKIEEINFESGSALDSIGYNSFSDSSIKQITLPQGIKFIGEAAFDNCRNLEYVSIPDSVTEIKDSAFRFSGLQAVNIPKGINTISNNAFYGCNKLEKIEFSEGVSAIGWNAFGSCSALKEVNLPHSLSWLDPKAFYNTTSLEKMTVHPGNMYYTTDDFGALYYCNTELVWYPSLSDNKTYVIPEGVTKLNSDIFWNAEKLEEVILPSTISKIDSGAFSACRGLKFITIPKEVTEIGSNAFSGCSNLSEIIFEEPSALSIIGIRAFQGCRNLKEITIPDSVTNIKTEAFGSCTYLEKVVFSSNSKFEGFSGNPFTGSHFVTVYAPEGSVAYSYAEKQRIHKPLIVNINGEKLISDVLPMLVNFRTMIPMRAVFEALEAEVTWNEQTKTAVAQKGDIKIEIVTASNVMTVNGKNLSLDSPAFIFEGRTMIPLRAVSEAFGYEVNWNQDSKTVDIFSK